VEIIDLLVPSTGNTAQSGVSFPIDPSPIFAKYFSRTFGGTLHPQPFCSVKFVSKKEGLRPWSSGLHGAPILVALENSLFMTVSRKTWLRLFLKVSSKIQILKTG
jgi:hypothetical protein